MKDQRKQAKRKLHEKRRGRATEESETSLVNMISVCAAAHPCVELVHSDNRAHWDTLFMLLIWLHTKRGAERCLDSIKKCTVVCILYLWAAVQRGDLDCYKANNFIRLVSHFFSEKTAAPSHEFFS